MFLPEEKFLSTTMETEELTTIMETKEFSSHRHPLNLEKLSSEEEEEESRICGLCGETVNESGYECSECKFIAHLHCAKNPPSLVIDRSKIHDHPLTLLPRHVSFTCNACGLSGDMSPYVCLMCSFMIHKDKDCIDFPGVIKITRHQHRLSHTFFLSPKNRSCGVCRQRVSWQYGAYSCNKCEDYAVHLKCAMRRDVWDGAEMEGVPEDDVSEASELVFSSDDDKLATHFAHEHHLRLQDGYNDGVCSGCALPLATGAYYKCDEQCNFFLHEGCAKLPRKKTTFLHVHPLTFCTAEMSSHNGVSLCDACKLPFNGFKYHCLECNDDEAVFDIRCCSIIEPVLIPDHKHPLYVTVSTNKSNICSSCGLKEPKRMLSCKDCSVHLCLTCATLPTKAIYKYDDHLLGVNTGLEDVTSLYLCDICEKKVGEKGSFYACFDCDPVLHTDCAVGSFRHMRPGLSFSSHGIEYKVILNDRTVQLRCSKCLEYCHEPLLLMSTAAASVTVYLCSSRCLTASAPDKSSNAS